MSDQWEKANGTDATRNDAWEDANRDGWSNIDEFLDYAHRQVLAGSSLAETQEYQDKPRTVTAWVVALTVAALAGLGGLLRAAMM